MPTAVAVIRALLQNIIQKRKNQIQFPITKHLSSDLDALQIGSEITAQVLSDGKLVEPFLHRIDRGTDLSSKLLGTWSILHEGSVS